MSETLGQPRRSPRHGLLSADIDAGTGECRACGPVPLTMRTMRGKRVPRCSVAVREQKGSYWSGSHGLRGFEVQAMRKGKTCRICGTAERLVIDHDHTTGKIRGVLCRKCNSAIGFFEESTDRLRAAIDYLTHHATNPLGCP